MARFSPTRRAGTPRAGAPGGLPHFAMSAAAHTAFFILSARA